MMRGERKETEKIEEKRCSAATDKTSPRERDRM